MLGCCAAISCRRMHATSLISLGSAELSMVKVFKAQQTAQTARLQSPKMCNFQKICSRVDLQESRRRDLGHRTDGILRS